MTTGNPVIREQTSPPVQNLGEPQEKKNIVPPPENRIMVEFKQLAMILENLSPGLGKWFLDFFMQFMGVFGRTFPDDASDPLTEQNRKKIGDASPRALDFSHEMTGQLDYRDGKLSIVPDDGGPALSFENDYLDVFDLSQSTRTQVVMDYVDEISLHNIGEHFKDGIKVTAIAHQDCDGDTKNTYVIGWRLSSQDGRTNYYIGQDSFVTPTKEWHPALRSGFEEHPDIDQVGDRDMDVYTMAERYKTLKESIERNAKEIGAMHGKEAAAQYTENNMPKATEIAEELGERLQGNHSVFPAIKP